MPFRVLAVQDLARPDALREVDRDRRLLGALRGVTRGVGDGTGEGADRVMNPENFERNDESFSPQVVAVSDKLTGDQRLSECATIQRSLTVVTLECSQVPGPRILSPNKLRRNRCGRREPTRPVDFRPALVDR
jgi:hypothetical protein